MSEAKNESALSDQLGVASEHADYAGVRCMCVLTGCRAGPGCPHYCEHCKRHIACTAEKFDPWKADRDAQMNPATDGDPGLF